MMLLTLFSALCLALTSHSLSIIFPLYLYPGEGGSAWNDLTSTIEAHPNVQWEVIVNPNSGPGSSGPPSDPNIISGVAKLNSYSNVNTIGYVDTGHTSKDNATVIAEVDAYASWAGYTGADIGIRGIYFDDVSIDQSTTSPGLDIFAYYQSVSAHARSVMKSPAHVVFNPGYRAPAQLFSYADTIVEFEDSLANYQSQGIIDQIPQQFRPQSALQIYDTPAGTDVAGLMSTMAMSGIEKVYFGADCCYKVYDKGLLEGMAAAA